jgi:hypothetical protein
MLSFVLIRYDDLDRLKAGLYFKDFSLHEYYGKIASKYKRKLPLIFGKWNLLEKILKVFSAYNFDIVIDNGSRSSNAGSLLVGGNQELFEIIRDITLYNKKLMAEFAWAALEAWKEYYREIFVKDPIRWRREKFEKVYPLYYNMMDVVKWVNPTDMVFPIWNVTNFKTRYVSSLLREMEESFANEITTLYYINLCNESYIKVSNLATEESFRQINCTPVRCLFSILTQDKQGDLREWFSKCMKDLKAFQEDILKITKSRMIQAGIE